MTAISEAERMQALRNPLYAFAQKAMLVGGTIQIFCLLAIIAFSILKPWGRRVKYRFVIDMASLHQDFDH